MNNPATVPIAKAVTRLPAATLKIGPDLPATLVVSPSVTSAVLEQYRTLATTLHVARKERQLSVIAFASAAPGDGKTLTATNIALTLSESYRCRTLLIDADLRRPSVHTALQIPNREGLADALRAARTGGVHEFPHHLIAAVRPRLAVITGGRPNLDPMADLASDRLPQLIRQGAEQYDWVIVDTPAVGLLPDARLLAAMADAVLFVIRANATPFALAERAIAAVGRDRILGVVMNGVDRHAETAGYNYGDYYDNYARRAGRFGRRTR